MALRLKHLNNGGPSSAETDKRRRPLPSGAAPGGSDLDRPTPFLCRAFRASQGSSCGARRSRGRGYIREPGECQEDSDRGSGQHVQRGPGARGHSRRAGLREVSADGLQRVRCGERALVT